MNYFIIFLIFAPIVLTCHLDQDCQTCLDEGCYFLKLFDNSYICSDDSHTFNSKFSVDSCSGISIHSNNRKEGNEMNKTSTTSTTPSSYVLSTSSNLQISPTTLNPNEMIVHDNLQNSAADNKDKMNITEINNKPFNESVGNGMKTNIEAEDDNDIQEDKKIDDWAHHKLTLRMKRNLCHNIRLWKLFNKKFGKKNLTDVDIMIKNNPMLNFDAFCSELILAKRVERLNNCTSCSSFHSVSSNLYLLQSKDCKSWNDCVTCTSSGCKFVVSDISYCTEQSAKSPPNSTIYYYGWCDSPATPTTSNDSLYEIGFWSLFTFVLILSAGILVFFFIRRKSSQTLPNTNEFLMHNIDIGTEV